MGDTPVATGEERRLLSEVPVWYVLGLFLGKWHAEGESYANGIQKLVYDVVR